jgi:NADPH:quinone reductase-like Zn-dependent oxidoreductase
MKAIVFTQYGPPDGLELKEVPEPTPKDDELLIRVHASSINSWDWEFLNGIPFINRLMYGLLKPKPGKQILGADIAGTVEAVGRHVKRFQPGDEVFGDLWDNWGGFAEYACANETSMEPKPANSTFAQAAAVPQAAVLALQGLRRAAQLKPGHKVLINGAGGGVGTFAIQLAKLSGAEVTGVDASHKLNVVRSVGADHVIDYTQEDFTKTGERYDLIIDCQNFRSMFDNRRALRAEGTYAMIGGSTARVYQLWFLSLIALLTREDRKLCLVYEGPNKGLADLKELIEAGKLVPIVDRTYQLSEVPEALRYFGEGRHKGKIVIAMES